MQRVLRSFRFATAGIIDLVRTQPNARVHLGLGGVVLLLAFWLGISRVELAILILTIGTVLVAEAVNTAVEVTVDLSSPSMHPLARLAKDVAAGAVLLSALTAIAVGALILGPRILVLVR
jgi:diacylglycerol kinase (ATP)